MKTGKVACKWTLTGIMAILNTLLLTANAQTARKFERHDIVEVANGRKAEIIQCRGEGPLEECDVIYYTTNRAQGTRTWENANRLREMERAAKLARDIQQGRINTLAKYRGTLKKDSTADHFERDTLAKMAAAKPRPAGKRGSELQELSHAWK